MRKRTKSEIFLWLSSSAIFLSAVIGIVAVVITTGTLYYVLLIFSIALGGVSAPTAILAGRQTALEQQERFERERQEREQRLKQEEEERKKGFMAAKKGYKNTCWANGTLHIRLFWSNDTGNNSNGKTIREAAIREGRLSLPNRGSSKLLSPAVVENEYLIGLFA